MVSGLIALYPKWKWAIVAVAAITIVFETGWGSGCEVPGQK